MPTEPELVPPAWAPKSWLARCVLHAAAAPELPRVMVELNGHSVPTLLDSGSTITLVRPSVLPKTARLGGTIPVSCIHGNVQTVPSAQVRILGPAGEWPIVASVFQNLPAPVLLRCDWLGFSATMKAPIQVRRPPKPRAWTKPACMARGAQDAGPSSPVNTHLGNPLPMAYFLVKGGLLYYRTKRRGKPCDLLVVPHSRTALLLYLAHTHLLGGHLGLRNTLEKLKDHFTWPRMQTEVQAFCRTCPSCQQMAPQKPAPAPLIPLPVIGVPFKRVSMDLIGPLPKSAQGHKYILVMMDYATTYPDAVPLRKATSPNIARELLMLFSHVGIPKDILTDQGTPVISRLTADLCQLLQVKHLRMSVYHWQTDGLVEQFNQTLKRMLRQVVDEDGRNWDLLLHYILFAIGETPQASTGFTPLELLFGQ
ncbi:hypothetical protein QTP70_009582 [Hemibagrus guttatus]|uniref:Gypsy retrotransposon integrase-like protein 1 n=1 Tax=Hemibagrus guttatus TaxID=175788 RepID=A0AAE0V870_9TELE|nr:hypothetical protein QTP70_009582 [Hemibagrus guttatus]KAK3570138.1 hypothetical protein QTP86_012513 [Hemibagrus guttatus]